LIFKFAFNKTSVIQSFFVSTVNPLTIQPHQAVEVSQIHGDFPDVLQPIDSFIKYLDTRKVKRFYIYRTFALGDILMLVPVIRELRKRGYDPYLKTIRWAKPVLDLLGIESDILRPHHSSENEYGIMMDGLVEQDHMRPKLSKIHRVDIYFKALGIEKLPKKLDWSIDLSRLPSSGLKGKYVVLQTAGSTVKKRLSNDARTALIKAFKNDGVHIVTIGEGNALSLEKLFAVIADAKCLITMDSGPLWISHFTKTPVVGIFGPTRPTERITYHPLWPDKVIGVRLNDKMNPPCKSCFENSKNCGDRMDCLKISGDRLYKLIRPHVIKILEADPDA